MREPGKTKLYIEDMQFLRSEQLHEISFKEFLTRATDELKKPDFEYLEKKISIFKGRKETPQELFDNFVEVFGLTREVSRSDARHSNSTWISCARSQTRKPSTTWTWCTGARPRCSKRGTIAC